MSLSLHSTPSLSCMHKKATQLSVRLKRQETVNSMRVSELTKSRTRQVKCRAERRTSRYKRRTSRLCKLASGRGPCEHRVSSNNERQSRCSSVSYQHEPKCTIAGEGRKTVMHLTHTSRASCTGSLSLENARHVPGRRLRAAPQHRIPMICDSLNPSSIPRTGRFLPSQRRTPRALSTAQGRRALVGLGQIVLRLRRWLKWQLR